MTVDGASETTVRRALESGDPLPGTTGFAGSVDGTVVRDVLGRRPVFVDCETDDHWSFDPRRVADPVSVPAGHAWVDHGFERVWSLPDPPVDTNDTDAVEQVRTSVRGAIERVDTSGLAIAFSGGVDSAALAGLLDVPLYVGGFPGCHDVDAARTAAQHLDADLRVVEFDHDDLERGVPELARAIRRTNAMDVQIALGLFLVAEAVVADGFDRLAVGQGADELFGGYAKVQRAPEDPRVEADTVRGARREVVQTLPDQLERDVLALRGAGIEPVAPLLDDSVVEVALRLPGDLLVSGRGERKWALRRAVRDWVPDEVAFREKKAVQYGSLVSRELDRLARQAGFKRRMDDHVTKYVQSLL